MYANTLGHIDSLHSFRAGSRKEAAHEAMEQAQHIEQHLLLGFLRLQPLQALFIQLHLLSHAALLSASHFLHLLSHRLYQLIVLPASTCVIIKFTEYSCPKFHNWMFILTGT